MAHCKSTSDRILAFEDMHVGAADCGRRDAKKRIPRPDRRSGLLLQYDATGSRKMAAFIGDSLRVVTLYFCLLPAARQTCVFPTASS